MNPPERHGVGREFLYRLDPDYTQPRLEIPEEIHERMRRRLALIYPEAQREAALAEIERLLAVHHAHKPPELLDAEATFDPLERFTERDALLITYGDLVLAEGVPPLKVLAAIAEQFFRGLITSLHILPFYPSSSDRGFSVMSYRQVDPALGTWDDIAELSMDFKLMFDAVFNHVSAQSRWFRQWRAGHPDFADYFLAFSSRRAISADHLRLILRPRTNPLLTEFSTLEGTRYVWTTFSEDQVDLNYQSPRVLTHVIDTLLYYVRRGADLVRLDAVTYIWHELGTSSANLRQTHELVKLFRDVLDVAAPHVGLVTETNVPHEENVRYFGEGHDEAQMVYNFALPPLVLHAFLRGDSTFLSSWARTLEPPSETTTYLNFLSSHDGIGLLGARGILPDEEIDFLCQAATEHGGFVSMRTREDGSESPYELNLTWFSALNRGDQGESEDLQIARFLASTGVMLALRGVPGIYMPSLIGAKNDVEAVMRSQHKRDINRASIRERDLRALLDDPASAAARVARGFRRMLATRADERAFHPRGGQEIFDLAPGLFALRRTSPERDRRVTCLVSLRAEPLELALPRAMWPAEGETLLELGSGQRLDALGDHLALTLRPYEVLWLGGDREC